MNVPKLRFKEFNDEWNLTNIRNISSLVTKGTTPKKYEDNGINFVKVENIHDNLISNISSYISGDTHNKELKRSILKENDILFSIAGALGRTAIVKKSILPANTNQANAIIRIENLDNIDLYYLLNRLNHTDITNYINKCQSVGAQPNLSLEQVNNINISLPSINEQNKIGNMLFLLDKKIELQSKKIEDLKLFKKGLILSLKKNSFDWHTVCIKDLFKITRGVVIPKNELSEFKSGEYKYPVYSSQTSNQGVLGYSDTFDFNGKYLTWTTDGANAGKVFYRNGKFRCTNVCGVLYEDNIRFTNELFAELLNYETPKHVSYVGNPKLMNNIMANIKIKIPSNEIQENISLVINTINHKVNLETNKLLKLQELKKGLMQNMFV
ncbi:MAG: restriction endonuclease subunit S [Sarcina ventriculi]|nr:restriction endonuclease subunit S [Sarcina ventriculi]